MFKVGEEKASSQHLIWLKRTSFEYYYGSNYKHKHKSKGDKISVLKHSAYIKLSYLLCYYRFYLLLIGFTSHYRVILFDMTYIHIRFVYTKLCQRQEELHLTSRQKNLFVCMRYTKMWLLRLPFGDHYPVI